MQPVFIRVLDNIRKQLEQSSWSGTYEDVPVWPDDVSDVVKAEVTQLQQQLSTARGDEVLAIEEALARLPQPAPGYQLRLSNLAQQVTVDLWQVCYRVCFSNYNTVVSTAEDIPVEIDQRLIDDMGEVDWQQLDAKASQVVKQIFDALPKVETNSG